MRFVIVSIFLLASLNVVAQPDVVEEKLMRQWEYVKDRYYVSSPLEFHFCRNDSVQMLTPSFKSGKWKYDAPTHTINLFFPSDTLQMKILKMNEDSLTVISQDTMDFTLVKPPKDLDPLSEDEARRFYFRWNEYKVSWINTRTRKAMSREKRKKAAVQFLPGGYGVMYNSSSRNYSKFYYGRLKPEFISDSSNKEYFRKKGENQYWKEILVFTVKGPPLYVKKVNDRKLVIESFYDTMCMGAYLRMYFKIE